MAIAFSLADQTGLDPSELWVAGWINAQPASGYTFKVLQPDGTFAAPSGNTVQFYPVSAVPTVTLSDQTNGNDRLLFVVSPQQPSALEVSNAAPTQYTQYPYQVAPGVPAPGPFDIFEFGMNAAADVSAVSGFGLNIRFQANGQEYGTQATFTRQAIGEAFSTFVANQAAVRPADQAFAELLYDGPITAGAPPPPSVDGQFLAIADPNDMLAALTGNYTGSTNDPLATYWDSTLAGFFAVGNYISINLSSNSAAPDIYSGHSSLQTNPLTLVTSPAFTLTSQNNPSVWYTFYMPPSGLKSAQYVFGQAFGDLTPAGASGDAGLLQDNIWEALTRGAALDGISTTPIANGESTAAWNNPASWYQPTAVSDIYAMFLHYADINGNDSRVSHDTPIFYGNSAYGFSLDENPDGPYNGSQVPSKTTGNVADGSTVTVDIGSFLNPEFATTNITLNVSQVTVGSVYTGPLPYLRYEYIYQGPDKVNVATAQSNVFIHTGPQDDAIAVISGQNVLDGGAGSNFLYGGSGNDTFFVDIRNVAADVWSTAANFHAGDAATVWGLTPSDFSISWSDGQGTAGYTGLTMHATAAGRPTASLTLAGYSQADLQNGRLSVQFGTDQASGSSYMYVHGDA